MFIITAVVKALVLLEEKPWLCNTMAEKCSDG